MKRQGFTLIELLITTAIIGVLATAGTTAYSTVRTKARDAKRVADARTLRNAIELYFEQHGSYPEAGPGGIELGSADAKVLSDAGFTPFGGEKGNVYLLNVPANVTPGGVPYVYRPLHPDRSACESGCASYEVSFALETPTGSLAAGPHLLTDAGIEGAETGSSGVSAFAAVTQYLPTPQQLGETLDAARAFADRAEIQTVNKAVVAPVAALGSVASVLAGLASAVPLANAGQFLLLAVGQPLLYLTRRKRQGWGTVYHAGTKVPIDLATVRLLDARTGRPVAAKVTDKDGRFAFTPNAGSYRIEVIKPGFVFPAASLTGVSEDGAFGDIYHGTLIDVTESGKTLTVNVPLDPAFEPMTDVRALLSARNKKTLRRGIAMAGPVLGAFALAVTPGLPMLLLFLVQLFLYQLYQRAAEPPVSASQGVVYDLDTRRPISRAIVRILSLPYHKVLETKLTDSEGRYAFNVGPGAYYLVAMREGYQKTETDPIDFTTITKPAWIASDLPMRKVPEAGKE